MRRGREGGPRWTTVALVALVAVTWCTVRAQDVKGCTKGSFSCADGSGCVDPSMVQDGVADCKDGSDEACRPLQFRCTCVLGAEGKRGPRCLDAEMVRDGVKDCADGEDERPEGHSAGDERNCPKRKQDLLAPTNQVTRSKRRASEVSTRIDGPVTTSMFAEDGLKGRLRPTGILTSTAGTFVLDGTTTEFATKVYGTHLDGGVYAKIVSTSSRVFFAVPSAGNLARIRPTGLLSGTTSTRVDGSATTLYTTEFSGTYIDGTYAQLVSSTSEVIKNTLRPTPALVSQTYQTVAPQMHDAMTAQQSQNAEGSGEAASPDQVVTVTGTRGALVDGAETKYDVFTGTHIKGDKTYLFFFGNTAISPSTTAVAGNEATAVRHPPGKASELVVRTGADDRIVVSVDDRELNLLLPKSARVSAAESGIAVQTNESGERHTTGGMRGVFIEGSEALGGFSIRGATEEFPNTKKDGSAQTEMLTVTVGRGVAQTKIVRGRYEGKDGNVFEQGATAASAAKENISANRVLSEGVQSERTVYRFPPRIPALRPPRPAFGEVSRPKTSKDARESEEEESENLLKAKKLDFKEEGDRNSGIRPSKVFRSNLPTFTVGQEGGFHGKEEDVSGKVVVRVDHNVEARVGARKDYRTLSARQRLGKSLPFRGFQVIHEKEDLVNAESGGSVAVPTITYFGFAEFTTTAHGTVIVFMPRSQEAVPSTTSHSPKITAVSAYRLPSTRLPGPAFDSVSGSGGGSKQKVATGIKTFYSHTPGMVTRTVTGHTLSMQTSLPTVLVEPVFGISAHGREKNGRSEDEPSDAELVYPTSDTPEETSTTEREVTGEPIDFLEPSISRPTADVVTSTSTFIENAHGRPFSVDLESSIISVESTSSVASLDDVIPSAKPTEPLQPSSTENIAESTETLPVGLIRSIEGTRALDGVTTIFTSIIFGTYINGDYRQLVLTTTNVLHPSTASELPTTPGVAETTERTEKEESSTTSNAPTVAEISETTFVTKELTEETTPPAMTTGAEDEGVISTIPMSATEENELANEVETGRKVIASPEEQVIVADESEKGSSQEKGMPPVLIEVEEHKQSFLYSVVPTTIYQTYTYFTTFYIPSEGTTSASVRSREVIVSELALVTRSYPAESTMVTPTVTAATESTTQTPFPTTPMLMVTEETPQLPRDRVTVMLDESTTAETPVTTPMTPAKEEQQDSEEDEEDSEEIELIFKTLYTTYTYLTTFFHDTTTSVSSREVVVTNVLTSTLNSVTLATEPALAGLVREHDLSTSLPSPSVFDSEEEIPTSVGVGRPTTLFFPEDSISGTPTAPLQSTPTVDAQSAKKSDVDAKGVYRTFYTTYTYFTTVFVDGETEISSRTEVYTNIIPPSAVIQPTVTSSKYLATSAVLSNPTNEVEPEKLVRPSITISNPDRYSSTIMRRTGRKNAGTSAAEVDAPEEIKTPEQDSIPISSENHEEKQNSVWENQEANIVAIGNKGRVELTTASVSVQTSEENVIVTTEKYFGVTKFEEIGEAEKLLSEEDDQESSESNTEVVLPVPLPSPTPTQYPETSILVQTTFTTFTYFTTLYRGGTSEVVSRLETVTNIMSLTVEPTAKTSDNILPTNDVIIKPTLVEQDIPSTTDLDESLYPITYFTTFTYWTTAYKGGSTVVNSREETVSNVVTPTVKKPAVTREIEPSAPIATPPDTILANTEVPVDPASAPSSSSAASPTLITPSRTVAAPQLTTFYTTYTYFTTSYVGDSTIVNSRLETVTNVEEGDTQTARAIGSSPPTQQQIVTPTKASDFPTGLLSTIRTSSVGEDSRTTLYSTDVYGTVIDGLYAKVLESSTRVLVEPISTSTPELPTVNLQPTGIVSLNAGSIVDAEGTATTFYSTMAIGTFIGNLYAQVVESTSSVVLDTDKTAIPLNTVSQRTGLVRLIKGSIVKGDATTFYESRVVGTVIDGRYAQIIESTSSFIGGDATKTEEVSVFPSPTTTTVLSSTAAPALESSLGNLGATAAPGGEDEQEEGGEGEGGEEGEEGDEEDSNNGNKGRVTSRLTFSSRRRTFTPVIRPFSSRNRPTFHPRRRPTSATTITRVTQTPTVTATPAHTDYLAATAARGRFSSRRGGTSSADVRASASGSRRFSRIRGSSSPGGAFGSSSYFGGSRGRGSSTRIIPTAASTLPFGGGRSRPSGYRSSFAGGGGRSSSEYPYGRTSSAALFAANSRYRIRPSSTSAYLRPTPLASASPPPLDRNTVEDEDEESTELEEEDEVGTEKEEGTRATEPTESTPSETALTATTEGTTSPFRNPLLRLRRPNQYKPPPPPSTTPSSLPRSTAARRLSLLRRTNGEENLPSEDRKPSRGRYKATSALPSKSTKNPTTPRPPRPSTPPRLQVLNRARPTSSLFPRRGLFRRPEEEKQAEEEAKESAEDDSEIVEEAESSANDGNDEDEGYSLDESIADNDYEASEDVRSKNDAPRVLIRPFSPRRRRLKRQVEYGSRGTGNGGNLRGYSNRFRRPGSRKSGVSQEAEARVGVEDPEVTNAEEEATVHKQSETPNRHSPARSRNSGQQRVRPNAAAVQPRTQYTATGNRNKNTNANTNTNNNNNNNNFRDTNSRTSFRRPSTTSSVRRRNKGETVSNQQPQQRPKPPRLRTQSDTQTATVSSKPRSRGRFSNRARQSASSTTNTGRSRYRTSDLESNDYSTRRQYQSSWDGKVTVTHQIPTEATIPVVNGKNTEYRRVITASPSTQILQPGQYEATEVSGLAGLHLIGSDVTATPTPGIIHVTQYLARETPTTTVEFTPTVIRGRKTSFSHVIPSTAYGVEEVISTLPSENGLNPSAPLANILLSQLLLGQFGLPGNVNPLLGLQQPNAAALAPPTPTTEFKTRSTTFVTTLTDKTSTVIPITLRGKAILTTIVDSSVQVVTATEFITETIVVTPTVGQQQQLNSLLLPALLQAQLLNQQQQQQPIANPLPGQLTPLQAAQLLQGQQQPTLPVSLNERPEIDNQDVIQEEEYADAVSPATERRRQPSSSRRRNRPHKRVEVVEEEREDFEEGPRPVRGSTEENPRPKTRKKQPSSGRKQQNPPAPRQYETSVITLYVSGRRPGDFSTVLSTISVDTAGSSLVKREAVSPKRIPSIQLLTGSPSVYASINDASDASPEKFSNSLPFKDPNILLDPSIVPFGTNFVPISEASKQGTKVFSHETESLESIVGDVSKHVVYQSSTWSPSARPQSTAAASDDSKSESTASSHSQTGHFLAYGPAELAPLKRKVLSIDEGVEEENEDEIEEYATNGKRAKRESDEEERPQKRRRVRVRVPVRKNPLARTQDNSMPTDHDQGEVLAVSEAQRKNAMRQEAEEISSNNGFPSQRIKVIRGQLPSKGSGEGDKEEGSAGRNKKRIRVKVRRKPNAVANNVLPQPAVTEGSQQGGTPLDEGREKARGSGRRRVVITKKRPSGTVAEQPQSRSAVVPKSSGRHRVVITRRRPVHRQSVQASTTRDQPQEDYPTIAPETNSFVPSRSIVEAPVIATDITPEIPIRANIGASITNERPTARKISSGIRGSDDDVKKIPPYEKSRDEGKYVSRINQPKLETEESKEDSSTGEEEEKTKPEVAEHLDEWVASKVVDSDYNLPTSKSVEPSFWGSREIAVPAETEILPPVQSKVSTDHQEETTGSEGPRFVRPTRFSVTRRPTGDFLQKVQSLRTKAPIVFPSRRRPSASTRQPAYRSRLSRLRGRPTSSSTTSSISTTTTFSETSVNVEPTQNTKLESPVIATPTQTSIYVTETVTETLLKTYTYVVSRVESSVEAGVAGEAAPPSLAAVSSTTEVKQVVKTRTVTRLLSPASATTTVPDTHSTALFSVNEGQVMEGDARAEGGRMNIEAARFNLATRIMSNGVEVIVAGDKTTLPGGPDVLRILSTASRPITLAPSTLTDQMQLTVPTALGGGRPQGEQESLLLSLQSQAANFVTKTYATTYTYLTTFLQGSSTVVSSREDVITNVVTEEVRPTKPIQQLATSPGLQNEALTSEVDGPPSFVTSTYRTTFTYLNTIIDGEIPVVLTTRQTVANTVTSTVNPSIDGSTSEESEPGYLQPSEPTMYDTNTYFNTFTLTKTLSDSASGIKVISTEDVLTQVVITEASTPATTQTQLKISPTSTTNIIKTYYVTYTYYNTFLEKGSTVVKTNVATSSDVVTEKFYLAPTRTIPKTPPIPETQVYQHPSQTSVGNNPSVQLPLNVFATKTYMTTFTYFTTLLENDQTVTRSSISVSTNLATEAITAGLDSVYLDSLRSSFSMQTAHAPIVATVMLSGTPMEITAFQGSVLEYSKPASEFHKSETSQEVSSTETKNVAHGTDFSQISPTASTSGNVIVGSTIIFFDDIKPQKPQTNSDTNELLASTSSISELTTVNYDIKDKETNSQLTNNAAPTESPEFLSGSISSSPTPVEGELTSENDEHIIPQNSYITSTITASTVIASGNGLATTLVPGDAVIVSMHPNGNISLIPVSDPTNKNPDGALLGAGAVSAGAGTLSGSTGGGLLAAASGGPNIGVGVGDLINLGSLSLNGLNALGPVFNAMAGLIQSNLKSSRRNDTTTPHPIIAPHTPPPIALPRPPAPQSAPLIRDPVYIPVGGLASHTSDHIEPIAAESNNGESIEAFYGQNFAIHGFPDTQERRPPPSPVKPSMPTTLTLDNPLLLQNGIPIQPGQVITTNSDVIVGKPSVLGPRPSSHGGIPQIYSENQSPLPQVHNSSPTVLVPSNHLPLSNYQRKPSVHPPTPPRARPGNDVPPEMRPPPPPRFQSYTGVSPTRVSVISGVETVFIGKPLPPHMVPENHSPASHHNHQIPSHITGPLRGDPGNYQSPANIPPPPIIVGSPLDTLNPHPVAFHQNHNTIDRSTGYKIRPSQSLNIPVEAVTLSVGSETNPNAQDPIESYFEISSPPLSGGRPGSVLNAGEPHTGPQITLGQAQVHNVPVGTGGEVVVEIGRPPITDVHNQYTEEAQIITNDDSSEDNRGVVQEEGEDTIKRHPTLITQHEQADHGIHTGSITIGHGRPNYQQANQGQHLNFFGQKRPNQSPSNIPPSSPFSHIHNPQSPVGAIQRPPPLSVVYTNGMSTHSSPVDHLMPPPPPPTRPNTNVLAESGGLHKNDGPIIIPLNHGHKETSHENMHSESLRPQHSENIPHPWLNNNDEDFGEPEDEEGAQDGEVLQESNNHPVRPVQLPMGEQHHLGRPSILPDILHNREKPQLSQSQHPHNGISLQHLPQNTSNNSPVTKPKVKPQQKINASEGNFANQSPVKHQNNLHEPPPYQFEIPDMPPPPLHPATPSPKPSQPPRLPPNSQRPPPGAVSRPAIRPQDYNPDFLDKPIRISSRPQPPSRTPINDGSTVQENVIRPEVSRPPVRVVVRPVSPHHPRPPYNNHHVAQSRPPPISHWSRPLHQLKPPGPGQVLRIPSPAPSRLPSSSWQPSISTTTRRKITPSLKIPHQEVAVAPTISSSLGNDANIRVSGVPPQRIDPSFSLERDPFVAISAPSSSESFVESSRTPALWEGDSFNSIPTIELPPPVATSILSGSVEPTTLLSGTSTIFGGLYSRVTSTKTSDADSTVLSDLFLSPSSHGAIAGNNGRPLVAPNENHPPLPQYTDEDEELENEFEEGEGLGAAGSNDDITSVVVVSVTATPTTRYVTRTETETHTITQTVVESRPGSLPKTRTIIVTQTVAAEMARPITIVSTIVGTVTEVHTTVEASTTTAVTTVTVTAPTQYPLHTVGSYESGGGSREKPENVGHAGDNDVSGDKTLANKSNFSQGSPFDSLRPTTSTTTTSEELLSIDHGVLSTVNEGDSKEREELNENVHGDEIADEEYTETILPTSEGSEEERKQLKCNPGCDASRNEICVDEEGEDEMIGGAIEGPRCICRPGFDRLFPDRPCMPTYTYQLRLLLDRIGKRRLRYNADLSDPQTEEFRQLQESTQEGLERVAMQSDLRDLFHGISIAGFQPLSENDEAVGEGSEAMEEERGAEDKAGSHDDGVIVHFYVKLSDNIEENKLKEMFEKTLKQSNYSVGGTELYARRKEGLLEISDFDECINPDFNDCSDQAQCFNLRGTYTCSCKEGFADLSENSEFPGRICSAEVLGCETCKYHGKCYTDTNGKVGCKCFHWYSGEKCQINLKVLLIALVTIGAILLILVFVCIMLACMKRRKPEIRHSAPGFMRYRGPAGIIRGGGTLDKTAMIPDTSSESSFEGALPPPPLTYVPLGHHRLSMSTQGSKLKSEGLMTERRDKNVPVPFRGPQSANAGFNEQDRSLTVMIPRAKYRPAPHLIASAASPVSPSPMTSFGVVILDGENREQREFPTSNNEHKLMAFLDGTDSHNLGRQGTPTKQKQIGPTVTNHESSGNPKKLSSSQKPSTGALVSAGFEVSATVIKDKWPPESSNNSKQIEDDADDIIGTGRGIDSQLHDTLASNGSHFTTLRTGDRTVSEARSYDETIVHPPKKSFLQGALSACGSKPSSQHGLHHSNDEAHTMAERDVGSTFLMPQTQLYKPSRGSDNSNFDSL